MRALRTRFSASLCTGVLSGALLLTAGLIAVCTGRGDRRATATDLVAMAVIAVAFFLAEQHMINFEFRRQAHSMTFAGVPLAIGILMLPVGELVLARLVGSLVAFVLQHVSPQKILYNTAAYCFEAALADAMVDTFIPPHAHVGLAQLAAMVVCIAALDQLMSGLVLFVIRLHGGRFTTREVVDILVPSLVLSTLATSFGVSLVLLGQQGRVGQALDVVLVGVGLLVQRVYAGTIRQHRSLAMVHQFVTEGAGADSLIDAAQRSLVRIRSVLGASSVELLLSPSRPDAGAPEDYLLIRLDEDDQVSVTRRELPAVDWVRSRAMHLGEPTLAVRSSDLSVISWLRHEGLQDAVVVPLQSGADVLGTLTVADRLSDNATFEPEDLTLLQTLTSHLAVSVRSARLLERLSYQATHDALTGLVNRAELAERINALDRADSPAAVLLVDLDKFKEVNDVLGHDVGDQLLVVVAERLRAALPPTATIARLGGDEFAILIPELGADDERVAEVAGRRLVAGLLEPVRFDDALISPEASIGIALSSTVAPQDLLRCADTAMYVAKAGDDAVAVFHPEMASGRAERLALVADLRLALDHTPEQFSFCYQPKIDLATGEVVSAEALVRWLHPTRGTVTPDRFIPLAEATGLVDKLTRHLLGVALTDCVRWRNAGHRIGVAVNLSPRNLAQDTIVAQVNAALVAAGASPDWLCLEITETVMMQDGNRAVRILGELAALGVEISLDDFGTGYSSLAYLQRLPVHELKIDRSFVAGLSDDDSANAPALFRSITALAGNLSLRVVAEGIETPGQLAAVTALGCDIGQGYLISRPLSMQAFLQWLEDRATAPAAASTSQTAELRLVANNG